MKKVFILLLPALLPLLAAAQFSKKDEKNVPAKDTIANTVDLKLKLMSDTSKVRIILFAKGDTDQFLSWVDGYLVVKTYRLPNGQVATTIGNLAYTQKWQLIKPEDIYDVKMTGQKN